MKKIVFPVLLSILCISCASKKNETLLPEKKDAQLQETAMHTLAVQDTIKTTQTKNQMIKISTSFGDMIVKLYDETPQHRDNFIKLTQQGFYNDLLFHRVIKDFMIQGGDPNSKGAPAGKPLGQGGPGYTIPAEIRSSLFHKRGALAAARQGDQVNPTKASSGSQFYIVQGKKSSDAELNQISQSYGIMFSEEQKKVYKEIGGTPFLDNNYTVFGEVVEGLDVIDKIAAVQKGPGDRPVQDIKMTVTLVENK